MKSWIIYILGKMLCSKAFTIHIFFLTFVCILRPYTVAEKTGNQGDRLQNYTKAAVPIMSQRRWKRGASTENEECRGSLIQSVVTFVGESLILRCSPCKEYAFTISVWKVQLQGSNTEVKMGKLGRPELVREGPRDCAIIDVTADLAGIYTCFFGRPRGYYEITVITLPDFKVVFTDDYKEEFPSGGDAYTKWGQWTKCSAPNCDSQGEQIKIGMCYQGITEEQYTPTVPCRSIVAARSPKPSSREDYKMLRECTRSCNANDRGVSMQRPDQQGLVTQESLFPLAGETTALSCSSISVVAYARWEKDGEMISQLKLFQEEMSRLVIDTFHTLHIHNMGDDDAGEYTCWHDDIQHVNYKLIITASPMNTESRHRKLVAPDSMDPSSTHIGTKFGSGVSRNHSSEILNGSGSVQPQAESGVRWTGIALSILAVIFVICTFLKLRKCGKC